MAKSTESISETSIVLVDKASHRHKMDNKLKIENCSAQERIHRIRGDILDLDLSQIDVIRKSKHVVGLTKHLCGVATGLYFLIFRSSYRTTVLGQRLQISFAHTIRITFLIYVYRLCNEMFRKFTQRL